MTSLPFLEGRTLRRGKRVKLVRCTDCHHVISGELIIMNDAGEPICSACNAINERAKKAEEIVKANFRRLDESRHIP